jgi:hypothetical protein
VIFHNPAVTYKFHELARSLPMFQLVPEKGAPSALKKDSKTAGHEIKNGFEDISAEVKGMFKKK